MSYLFLLFEHKQLLYIIIGYLLAEINPILFLPLQGVLALRFTLSNTASDEGRSDIPPGLIPAHKQSVVLFLERVYGMDNKDLFFSLLEDAFLPDLRAATMLDKVKRCFMSYLANFFKK